MKRLHCILIAALIILFYNVQAFAQTSTGSGGQTIYEPFKQSVHLESTESAVTNLPSQTETRDQINSEKMDENIRQLRVKRITDNFEELNKASAALSAAAETVQNDKSAKKKAAKLANKIAKLSKDLRKDITEEKSAGKVVPALPAANVGINGSVESIEKLVKEVTKEKDRLLYTSDLALAKESSKKLETIESQALGIADLLR